MSVPTHLHPTRHAREVMASRGVEWREVCDIVAKPERMYRSRGDYVFQSGSLAVVVSVDGAVITVLLRTPRGCKSRWDDSDVRSRKRVNAQ